MSLGLQVLPIEVADLSRAKQILFDHPHLSTRDAVHLGVMQGKNISKIVSYDKGFSQVKWAERIEP